MKKSEAEEICVTIGYPSKMPGTSYGIPAQMSSADLLRACGRALYGARWQAELAAALCVGRRSMQRWLAGSEEPSQGVWRDIGDLLEERRVTRQSLARALRDLSEPT